MIKLSVASILVVCLACMSQATNACIQFPHSAFVSPNQLIERTENIVLAQVTAAKVMFPLKQNAQPQDINITDDMYSRLLTISDTVEYTLVTIETIKGEIPQEFTIKGSFLNHPDLLTTFDHHESDIFWSDDANGRSSGRIKHLIGCEIAPAFDVGGIYLVFLDDRFQNHSKGFERIVNIVNDKWVNFVRSKASH